MRIATYNQMFALDGTRLHSTVLSYLSVNFRKKSDNIYAKASIDRTAEVVVSSKADIVGICEILEDHEGALREKLFQIGYPYVFFANGHTKKYSKIGIMAAIASKFECKQIEVEGFPIKNTFYGGGGMVHCYIPKLDTNIIHVHMAIPTKRKLYMRQIAFLQRYILKIEGKLILMGDFNMSFEKLGQFFDTLNLASCEIKTCSNTRWLKHIKFDDIDHIFVKGFKVEKSGALEGYSDHRLIYSDLK
ncbi:MAG: endonuclease/exonuclease/phosphatase family protein [Candidatus Pacearchaeota archaeon]|jgi:endonuclease/exonuclease/phosphatase family metal-dependent hydrolase